MSSCVQLKESLNKLLNLSAEFTSVYSHVEESKGYRDPANKQAIESSESLLQEIRLAIRKVESYLHISLQRAQEIMEKEGYEGFLGPEAINRAFGMELSPEQIPPITFSQEQLERARALDQMLVLRIDKVKDQQGKSQPLNVAKIAEISLNHNIKLRDLDDWMATDQGPQEPGVIAIKDQTPRSEWVLVSRELIPDTINKNYLEQTEILIKYLKNEIFPGQDLPHPYQEAIQEFEQVKRDYPDLADLTVSRTTKEWKKAAKILSELKITRLLRRSAIEILYDLYLYKVRYDKYLLSHPNYDWSSSRYSDGKLTELGDFDSLNVNYNNGKPVNSLSELGASLSCRS